jgi:hypothetical protein
MYEIKNNHQISSTQNRNDRGKIFELGDKPIKIIQSEDQREKN